MCDPQLAFYADLGESQRCNQAEIGGRQQAPLLECDLAKSEISDEVADSLDHANLRVTCRVNGVTKQDSNTKFLYFKLPRLIADLSQGMTLEAGDIISTGTPPGVGLGLKPTPDFLKPGDVVEVEAEGIGTLRNAVVDDATTGTLLARATFDTVVKGAAATSTSGAIETSERM